jgi:hypothetical protein
VPDAPGDRVHLDRWVLEVVAIRRHAITVVRATPVEPAAEDTPA